MLCVNATTRYVEILQLVEMSLVVEIPQLVLWICHGSSHENKIFHGKPCIFKPSTCGLWPFAPGFLKLLWFMCRYVCVSAPKAINNQWRDMV